MSKMNGDDDDMISRPPWVIPSFISLSDFKLATTGLLQHEFFLFSFLHFFNITVI